MSVLIWIQTVWYILLVWIQTVMIYSVGSDLESNCLTLKDFFMKKTNNNNVYLKKTKQTTTKAWKITQHAKSKVKVHEARVFIFSYHYYFNIILWFNSHTYCTGDQLRLESSLYSMPFIYLKDEGSDHTVGFWLRLLTSDDHLCKQFGSRSEPTECKSWSVAKPFDIFRYHSDHNKRLNMYLD